MEEAERNLTCAFLEHDEYCAQNATEYFMVDPVLTEEISDDPSRGTTEQCCMCGGGQQVDPQQERLISWKLFIYGHAEGGTPVTIEEGGSSENGNTETGTENENESNEAATDAPESGAAVVTGFSTILLSLALWIAMFEARISWCLVL